ncbi:hypothetical protein Tco_0581011 [Tanacetum coccineum]
MKILLMKMEILEWVIQLESQCLWVVKYPREERNLRNSPVKSGELLSEDILGATTQRDTRSYYPKRYWELLPKKILGVTTQRDTGSYYLKRYWEILPKEILGAITQREHCYSWFKHGASCTQRKVSMVPFVFNIPFVLSWGGSKSSDSFLPSIMLLVAKYALEIHKKHGMDKCDSFGTPLATKPKLDANLSGKPIDQTNYCSMIGSLMYLTSSRPDLVQAVCYYAHYQARPTEKNLKEVKRIFRYLKGIINIKLWYLKDSGFELTAFSDADHAGCIDPRKSTSRGIQFLDDKLVS